MDLNRYQNHAKRFAVYEPKQGVTSLMYCGLGLAGEAGELANKIKKIYRDDNGIVTEEVKQQLIAEMGDTLWYLQQICTELEISFSIVALANISKLNKRRNANVLHGSGDDR